MSESAEPEFTTKGSPHAECRPSLVAWWKHQGIDATVSAERPLVPSPYGENSAICPHGTEYWMEPSTEQIAAWIRDKVA